MVRSCDFSLDEKWEMVRAYVGCGGFYTRAIRVTGMPVNRFMVASWIRELAPEVLRSSMHDGTRIPVSVKREAAGLFHSRDHNGLSVSEIAHCYNVARQTIYRWVKETASYDETMKTKTIKEKVSPQRGREVRLPDMTGIHENILPLHLCLERDVCQAILAIGVSPTPASPQACKAVKEGDLGRASRDIIHGLRIHDKARVTRFLSHRYPVSRLCRFLGLSVSTYYYQKNRVKHDKYQELRRLITKIFYDNDQRYGYRRIKCFLEDHYDKCVSEKVVSRLMREEGLHVIYHKKKQKYNSYAGENNVCPANLVNRDFHASEPGMLWLSDITEFSIPAGKIYLSPVLDVYDSRIVSYTISTSPDAELVNTMLENACRQLSHNKHPIIHTDRGMHYRWPGWVALCEYYGLTPSMSRKGKSGDNAACEGFFGRMKNEMFYYRDWTNTTLEDLANRIHEYITWYNTERYTTHLTNGKNSPRTKPKPLNLHKQQHTTLQKNIPTPSPRSLRSLVMTIKHPHHCARARHSPPSFRRGKACFTTSAQP